MMIQKNGRKYTVVRADIHNPTFDFNLQSSLSDVSRISYFPYFSVSLALPLYLYIQVEAMTS